ncbi:MAG: hypothetical protein M3162_06480 [Thermoproteota archaeon]|nr:hypothetical protein [Thermoproteota archaeon]
MTNIIKTNHQIIAFFLFAKFLCYGSIRYPQVPLHMVQGGGGNIVASCQDAARYSCNGHLLLSRIIERQLLFYCPSGFNETFSIKVEKRVIQKNRNVK